MSEKAKEIEAINGIVAGKNVLITGGAAGLGCAFLNHFIKHGANVSVACSKVQMGFGKGVEFVAWISDNNYIGHRRRGWQKGGVERGQELRGEEGTFYSRRRVQLRADEW